MGRRGLLDTAVPPLRQHLVEQGKQVTAGEVAEFLGVSRSAAYTVLLYMEAIGIIHHVKRGRKKLYFLKGDHDESRLAATQSRPASPRRFKRRKRATPVERTMNSISEEESLVEHHPSASRDMLPALAILGIHQPELRKPPTPHPEPKLLECVGEGKWTKLFIAVERHGRVKFLPMEARLLSRSYTTYLKERYLRGLDGYEDIERFNTFFAEAKALTRGEYGNVYYASMGTNPWAKLYKVTVKRRDEFRSRDEHHLNT